MVRWVPRDPSPEANVVWSDGRWYSYQDLVRRSSAIAALVGAQARPGTVARRPIVPLLADNSFELVAAYLGVIHAGAIPALIPQLSDDATAAVLADVEGEFAFVDPARLDTIRRLGASRAVPMDLALRDEPASSEHSVADPHELALMLYTSGSTSTPRAVMLSANNLRFNAEAILDAAPTPANERSLMTLPLHYCYGLSVLHTHLLSGAAVVFPKPAATPGELLDLLDATSATGLPSVPSLVQTVLRDAAARERLARLRYVMVSGGKLPDHDLQRLIDAAPNTRILIRYGITETSAAASFLPPERLADKLGSIGRGLRGAPLHVIGDDGRPITPGTDRIGEIHVRGDHVALGYFRCAPDATNGFVNGTYHTGDRARVDEDGYVYIVGRTQSFVKTGSHRVAVEEIEDVLGQAPGVACVAVGGVPHPTRGEALVALVVARTGELVTPVDLRAHCTQRLPPFKVPVEFRFVSALPMTVSGKLDRRAVGTLLSSP